MKNRYFLPVIFLIVYIHVSAAVWAADKFRTITTDHFKLSYTLDDSNYTAALTYDLEKLYSTISGFLEYDSLEKTDITVTDKSQHLDFVYGPGMDHSFYVSAEGNYDLIKTRIYDRIFLMSLGKILNSSDIFSLIDRNFYIAIKNYPFSQSGFLDLQIYDLIKIQKTVPESIKSISKINSDQQQVLYSALIDFIFNNYGKKIFLRSLKDTVFYNGFINSLTAITGDTVDSISINFNSYLNNRAAKVQNIDKAASPLYSHSEFTDIAYSVSGHEQITCLQRKGDSYRLVIKTDSQEKTASLKKSEPGSFYHELCYINDGSIAITEILESGSRIHIYNTESGKFTADPVLYYIFIRDINSDGKNNLIFSASSGLKNDIFSYNTESSELKILTESGNSFSPVVIGMKLYYITKTDKYSIIELNTQSGESKVLFSTDQLISGIDYAGNYNLVLGLNFQGIEKTFTINVGTGTLRMVNVPAEHSTKQSISGNNLYYFSYYNNKYRLFVNRYIPE